MTNPKPLNQLLSFRKRKLIIINRKKLDFCIVYMDEVISDKFVWNFWGWGGAALALTLANIGSAYGTAKSGMGIAAMAVTRPHLAFKSIVPVIMAGILSIYGLIIAVLIAQSVKLEDDRAGPGIAAKAISSGLVCGLSQLAAGYAIGLVGEQGVKCHA